MRTDSLKAHGGLLTHHGGSSLTNNIRPLLEGFGVHDAGGGDVQRHHVKPQQYAEENHRNHLEH